MLHEFGMLNALHISTLDVGSLSCVLNVGQIPDTNGSIIAATRKDATLEIVDCEYRRYADAEY